MLPAVLTMSGLLKISPSDDMMSQFNALKLTKKSASKDGEKAKYMIFAIQKKKDSKDESVEVEESDTCSDLRNDDEKDEFDSKCLKRFIDKVTGNENPRFAVIDYRSRIFYVYWSPEGGNVRQKMKYSSVSESVKTALSGIHNSIQATDAGEMSAEVFNGMIKKI